MIQNLLINMRLTDILDIALVSMMVYAVLQWIKGSRAFQLVKGVLLLAVVFVVSKLFGLTTIEWVLQKMAAIIMIFLIIVFQPELRRGLERLGRQFFLWSLLWGAQRLQELTIITQLTKAVGILSEQKTGALIIIERTTGLNEYVETGVRVDALVSVELLVSVFNAPSPLHDGAVIIQNERLAAASCVLPISDMNFVTQKFGTRHRAGIGISEVSDAVTIIVSEETGGIAIAENGTLTRYPNKESLNARLLEVFRPDEGKK